MTNTEIALTAAVAVPLWAVAIGVWLDALDIRMGRFGAFFGDTFSLIANVISRTLHVFHRGGAR